MALLDLGRAQDHGDPSHTVPSREVLLGAQRTDLRRSSAWIADPHRKRRAVASISTETQGDLCVAALYEHIRVRHHEVESDAEVWVPSSTRGHLDRAISPDLRAISLDRVTADVLSWRENCAQLNLLYTYTWFDIYTSKWSGAHLTSVIIHPTAYKYCCSSLLV